MELIKFINVEKSFKGRKVISGLNFSIHANEVVALLGANGSGKTTTIRMLLGISKPDSGRITRWTKDFNQKVGAQLQTTPFFEGLSVINNLKLFNTFYQSKITTEKMERILRDYNLLDVKNTLASKLSLGQQKRLAISITTLHDPDFVILDEPSAGLDPSGQREVQNMIRHLKSKGKSVLFSSHDMLEVRNLADRIFIMGKGRLLVEGKPETLLNKYNVGDFEELFNHLMKKEEYYV
ncbi:ABC transporter ATP-binding protein [Ornithinibacillus massiliensis]|uniref:ABC transporter ATP-binding protein n=1 Tax=Ornithinibacillus massiliensis TaxID=1944633 RepID=A0ABS5MHR8_9BACI|nr:ABC transporter ATP-binding protein [Ornithinibacillus massiliensis]MBS3681840.1 ABC transporter ATP-binding protein [Ornithinibacillus massiliensis]